MTAPDINRTRRNSAGEDSMKRRPKTTRDLALIERCFLGAMRDLDFGRFEHLRIAHGKLVLDPWPTSVRIVRFGSADAAVHKPLPEEFELKGPVIKFFEFVRTVDAGEIRCLQVRHGIPVAIEIDHRPNPNGGCRG
jgi:hypothetical protein